MTGWLRYLIAFVVFCHGFVYVRIGAVLPGPIAGWRGASRLLGGAVTGEPLIVLVRVLHVAAGVAILACAFAIAFAPAHWSWPAIAGSLVGFVAFAVFWDGQTRLLFEEGAIGVAASALLLAAALIFPSAFAR